MSFSRGTMFTMPVLLGGGAAIVASLPVSMPMIIGYAGGILWPVWLKLREFWCELDQLRFRGSFGYHHYKKGRD
ncbi:MAG TPA: hypothetical protein VEF76_00360 [Patescibacteria group bacterium]|nr:hypothetical protein [Patescibacteria group bacterium]